MLLIDSSPIGEQSQEPSQISGNTPLFITTNNGKWQGANNGK